MIPVTNVKDAHAQYFLVNDEFRLADLRTSAQPLESRDFLSLRALVEQSVAVQYSDL